MLLQPHHCRPIRISWSAQQILHHPSMRPVDHPLIRILRPRCPERNHDRLRPPLLPALVRRQRIDEPCKIVKNRIDRSPIRRRERERLLRIPVQWRTVASVDPFGPEVVLKLPLSVVELGLRGEIGGADEKLRGSGVDAVRVQTALFGNFQGGLPGSFGGRVLGGPRFASFARFRTHGRNLSLYDCDEELEREGERERVWRYPCYLSSAVTLLLKATVPGS